MMSQAHVLRCGQGHPDTFATFNQSPKTCRIMFQLPLQHMGDTLVRNMQDASMPGSQEMAINLCVQTLDPSLGDHDEEQLGRHDL